MHIRAGAVRRRVGFAILAFAILIAPRQSAASTGCDAVNSGVFNATVTTAQFLRTTSQAGFATGDQVNFTITAGGHSHFNLSVTSGPTIENITMGNQTLLKSYTLTSSQLSLTLQLIADLFDSITVSATCVAAVPTVTSISPTSGTTTGGTAVTIGGTNFTGATSVTVGGVAATSVVVVNDTTITAATSAHAAGVVDVQVTTPGGTGTGTGLYTYVTPAPTVTSISPTSGTTAGGTAVTIGGTNFTGATSVTVGGVAATSVVVVNATTITATTPAHGAGAVDVQVTTPGGTGTGSGLYTFVVPAPTVTAISPTSGTSAGGTAVTITGTNLTGATSATIGGVAVTSLVVVNTTTVTAIAPAHAAGVVDVTVTTPGGTGTGTSLFTYIAVPTVTAVSPTNGPIAGGTAVTITGTNLTGATGATIGGVAVTGLVVVNATTITAMAPAHAAGGVDVTVTTPGGTGTGTSLYTYIALPTVTAISPATGPIGGGTAVTITGTNLSLATSVTIGGAAATGVAVVNATTITATTPAHAAGVVDVTVTTPGGTGTGTSLYNYASGPTVTAVSPTNGPIAGGTAVTITGTNLAGATAATMGGAAVTSLVVVNPTTITAVAPSHAAGSVDVTVTTPGGVGTGTGLYTYADGPLVMSISPSTGPTLGGTAVTITGANFTGTTSVRIGGVTATGVTVLNATTLTATTDAHAAGLVDVVVTTPGGTGTGAGLYRYADGPTVTAISPSTGPVGGGTAVTITGANLAGATAVTIGGAAATGMTVVSSTTITAITPAHAAGAADVVVTTPAGTTTGTGLFTYVAPALPTVSAVAPASGTTAGGTAITITGGALGDTTSVTVGGVAVSELAIVNPTTVTARTPAHAAGVVDVVVTTPAGSAVVRYTYIAPLALASATSTAMQVGQPYSQANTATGGTPAYAYKISAGSLPAGLSLNTSTGLVSGTPSALGAFSYTVEVTDSGVPPLVATQVVSGTIAPIVTTTALTSSENPSMMGQSVTLTARVTPAVAAGSLKFTDGPTTLCDAVPLVNGGATCAAAFTTPGVHPITAVYGGSTTHGTSTSAVLVQTVNDQRIKTVEAIGQFVSRRNDLIAANEPDVSRQIDRLVQVGGALARGMSDEPGPRAVSSAADNGGVSIAPPAANSSGGSVSINRGPVGVSGSSDGPTRFAIATSLSRMRRSAGGNQTAGVSGARPALFDVWIDGKYVSFRDRRASQDVDGHFRLVSVGADYLVNSDVLVGGMAQFDGMRQHSNLRKSEASGHGWMAGPYATIRLTDQLFWQGRAAWGRSNNDVSPFESYTDEFGTNRWLISTTLSGRLERRPWVLRPSASVAFLQDVTSVYADTFGAVIPEVRSRLGQFKAGPQFEYRYRLNSRFAFEPRGALQLVSNFAGTTAGEGLGRVEGTSAFHAGVRGRAEIGMRVMGANGFWLEVAGSYDGIGASDYPSFGGQVMMRVPVR